MHRRACVRLFALALHGAVGAGCDRASPPTEPDRAGIIREILDSEFQAGVETTDGAFVTGWRYDMSALYRASKRRRARVKLGDTIAVEVTVEINDNLANPESIENASWGSRRRDEDAERTLRERIERALP